MLPERCGPGRGSEVSIELWSDPQQVAHIFRVSKMLMPISKLARACGLR